MSKITYITAYLIIIFNFSQNPLFASSKANSEEDDPIKKNNSRFKNQQDELYTNNYDNTVFELKNHGVLNVEWPLKFKYNLPKIYRQYTILSNVQKKFKEKIYILNESRSILKENFLRNLVDQRKSIEQEINLLEDIFNKGFPNDFKEFGDFEFKIENSDSYTRSSSNLKKPRQTVHSKRKFRNCLKEFSERYSEQDLINLKNHNDKFESFFKKFFFIENNNKKNLFIEQKYKIKNTIELFENIYTKNYKDLYNSFYQESPYIESDNEKDFGKKSLKKLIKHNKKMNRKIPINYNRWYWGININRIWKINEYQAAGLDVDRKFTRASNIWRVDRQIGKILEDLESSHNEFNKLAKSTINCINVFDTNTEIKLKDIYKKCDWFLDKTINSETELLEELFNKRKENRDEIENCIEGLKEIESNLGKFDNSSIIDKCPAWRIRKSNT